MFEDRPKLKWYLFGVLIGVNILIWYHVFYQAPSLKMSVDFMDVGQGDAIFIKSPVGNQVLVDGGPNSKILEEIGNSMSFFDRKIDLLIISNPDKDHIAGFIDVLKKYDVGAVVLPGTYNESLVYQELNKLIEQKGVRRMIAKRGMVIDIGGGAKITFLFPDRDVSGLSVNEGSIVAKLEYGDTATLLMGDSTKGIEEYLVDLDGEELNADILKVGHHGSKTSTSEEFLSISSPKYAVISSGRGNPYGHPNKETLEALKRFNVDVLRTDEKGTIRCQFTEKTSECFSRD